MRWCRSISDSCLSVCAMFATTIYLATSELVLRSEGKVVGDVSIPDACTFSAAALLAEWTSLVALGISGQLA